MTDDERGFLLEAILHTTVEAEELIATGAHLKGEAPELAGVVITLLIATDDGSLFAHTRTEMA